MEEKTRTFLVQVIFSLGMVCFCIGMIASDKDKMLPIFLPLLTAQIGIWTPGPKMKKKKEQDPELGNVKTQLDAQRNLVTQLSQVVAARTNIQPPPPPTIIQNA